MREHIERLLIEPKPIMRAWDYGEPGEEYLCWNVLEDSATKAAIAYCEQGFGPGCPWGLVNPSSETPHSIGEDCAWYPTFLRAVFESWVVAALPIWRVFKKNMSTGDVEILTAEGEWDATWEKVMSLRESDPTNRYDCDTSVAYAHE